MKYIAGVLIISVFSFSCQNKQETTATKKITKIVFGSCSDQKRPVQLWQEMANQKADYALLLGDNVYADFYPFKELEAAYNMQKNDPGYQALMQTSTIYGTWDDHDYGANDAGKFLNTKDSAQLAFINFFKLPENSPVRNRGGIYQSYNLDNQEKYTKLILLDTRYFRDTLMPDTTTNARYILNEEGDILGEEQWKWLEEELTESKAELHLIASSIQVLSEEHPYEKWANFPSARKRLFELIKRTQAKNVIFLSGDRHISEVSKMELSGYPTPLYDITSSGLSHTWRTAGEEANKHRVGELIIKRSYGLLRIDWDENSPDVALQLKGHQDSTFLSTSLVL